MGPPHFLESTSIRSANTVVGKASMRTGTLGGMEPSSTTVASHGAASIDREPNPFTLPADEDIFRLREEERTQKAQARAVAAATSVRDKTTMACRMAATFGDEAVRAQFQDIVRDTRRRPGSLASGNGDSGVGEDGVEGGLAAAATGGLAQRRVRENIAEFVAKKREIFLVQMSLDTKRAEIRKLQERTRQREEALKKSEQMLDDDAVRFDAFLKENDDRVQDAIKKAEVEAKAKQDKVLEIKRLNAAIASLRSELNRQEESLEDCKRYKDFLDSVTPAEWFEALEAKRKQRQLERMQQWQAECEAVRQRKEAAQLAKSRAEVDFSNARTQQEAERAEKATKEAVLALKEALKLKEPPKPDLAAEAAAAEASATEDAAMHFTSPQQLLAVYAQLEESNLFLIQNSQETEEALEEIKAKQRETVAQLDAEVATLHGQVQQLTNAISAARERGARLKERTLVSEGAGAEAGRLQVAAAASGSGAGTGAGVSLDQLADKVAAVYVKCGFDADASVSTIQMLTNIEVRLEECLATVDQLPRESVNDMEKAREKERRQLYREEKLDAQKQDHEARVQRALERASAPVFQKTGKPQMTRSAPPKRKAVVRRDERDAEEAELAAFLARELL